MPRRTLIILLVGILLLVAAAAAIYNFGLRVPGRSETSGREPRSITLCDTDASGICVISFGMDSRKQLVINLNLPGADLPPFRASVEYLGDRKLYQCQVVGEVPSIAYCAGERPPLGALVTLRLYAIEDDRLLAEGQLAIRAVALPTFSNATATLVPGHVTQTASLSVSNGTPTLDLPTLTPTPLTGYPGAYP